MMTGLAYMTGPRGQPLRVGSSANDIMGGMHGTMSIMGALLQRARSGKGKMIRIGLFENCLLMVAQHMVHFELTGEQAPPMPNRDFSWPVYDIFNTADGGQVFVSVVTETQWLPFCDAFALDELTADGQLPDQLSRIHARSWTIPLIAKSLVRYTAAELMAKLEGLGLAYSPINRPADLYTDPHVLRPHGLVTSKMPDGHARRVRRGRRRRARRCAGAWRRYPCGVQRAWLLRCGHRQIGMMFEKTLSRVAVLWR